MPRWSDRVAVRAVAVRAAALGAVLLLALATRPGVAAEKIVLQLRWDHQFQFAGYYAALWQGYYAEAGLDVEIRSALPDAGTILSSVDEVAAGRADFGIGAADILLAADRGRPLVVVASVFQSSAAAFYALDGTPLARPADLLRLKVARQVDSLIDIEMQAMMRAEGLDPGQVSPHAHQPGLAHLLSGQVDVIPGYDITMPAVARLQSLELKALRPLAYGIDFYGDSLFTSRRLAETDPGLVRRFRDASLRGWAHALAHPYAIAERIVRDLLPVAAHRDQMEFQLLQAERVAALVQNPLVELGHANPGRWQQMHDALTDAGLVSTPFDPTMVFDPDRAAADRAARLRKWMVWGGSALVLALVFALAWAWSMNRAVRRATQALREANQSLEARVLARTAALQASETRFRAIATTAADAVFTVDGEGRVAFWNPAAARLFGHGEVVAVGAPAAALVARTDWQSRITAALDTILARTAPQQTVSLEFEARGAGGPVPARLSIAGSEFDGAPRAVCIVHDLTERTVAEQRRMAEAHDRAQRHRLEALGTVAAAMAHEINNALVPILGLAEVTWEMAEDAELKRNLQRIRQAGERARRVVAQVTTYAHSMDHQAAPINLAEAVHAGLHLVAPTLPAGVRLDHRIADTALMVRANRQDVHQVLLALSANAVEALAGRGGIIRVELGGDGTDAVLRFIDNGPGMSEEVRGRACDPFYTTKDVGEGMGIGLAMVEGLVHAWGGTVRLQSRAGEGTEVTITLPIGAAARDPLSRKVS